MWAGLKAAKRFLRSEEGPTVTEYAMMLALIVLVCVGALSGIGHKVEMTFTTLDANLPVGSNS